MIEKDVFVYCVVRTLFRKCEVMTPAIQQPCAFGQFLNDAVCSGKFTDVNAFSTEKRNYSCAEAV